MNTTPATVTDSATRTSHSIPQNRLDRLFNRVVKGLTRVGISVLGTREIRIVGRRSGQMRSNVVNLLTLGDERYLVAPRGTTDWVRNLRVAEVGELRLGRRSEAFRAVELSDDDKLDVLRSYLQRWAFEVGRFFDGVDANSSDAEIARIAPGVPVFMVRT